MKTKNIFHWYEAMLPSEERKLRGHFSTPPLLVEQILDACSYTPEHDLAHLRVLDPACGSGNFLVEAMRRLLAYGEQKGLGERAMSTLIQRNMWGLDLDPGACFLAEMQMREAWSKHFSRSPRRRFHIHQADGLVLPWGQTQNVDLFLVNPPYRAAKNADLSRYYFKQERGQPDSYLFFLRLALQITRPDGWIALVLPDAVLARSNATQERRLLLEETTIHHLWHLANVFTACVSAVVIIAQKRPAPSMHWISWKRAYWLRFQTPQKLLLEKTSTLEGEQLSYQPQTFSDKRVLQTSLRNQPGAEFRYLLSSSQETMLERIHTHIQKKRVEEEQRTLVFLDECVLVRRGEEIGKESSVLREGDPGCGKDGEKWFPVLRGGVDVRAYEVPLAQRWIEQREISKPLERYLRPKLLVIKSAERLQATLDLQGHVVLQTLYLLQLKEDRPNLLSNTSAPGDREEDELYFLLALLNSRLLREYLYVLHTAYKLVQPQIEQHVLARLPVPLVGTGDEKEQIVQRARLLMGACSAMASGVELKEELYEEQERAICALYRTALEERRLSGADLLSTTTY